MSNVLPTLLGLQRTKDFPLDSTSVFSTFNALTSYAANDPTAYAGQICAVSATNFAYIIKNDKTVIPFATSDGTTFLPSTGGTISGNLRVTNLLTVNGNISANNLLTSFNRGSATGDFSFAVNSGRAVGEGSFAAGNATATGLRSFAEGLSLASGQNSHSEGNSTTASGQNSHAEGEGAIASGSRSHAEGSNTQATNIASHAEGSYTKAQGLASHTEGIFTEVPSTGFGAHAEGSYTEARQTASHAEGSYTIAAAGGSHAEGSYTIALGSSSHTEGGFSITGGVRIPVSGFNNETNEFTFSSSNSAIFANVNTATKWTYVNAELNRFTKFTIASRNTLNGNLSTVEDLFFSEPLLTSGFIISGANTMYNHAEGYNTLASGQQSHAEGNSTTASGSESHAEGNSTTASGQASHAEGETTLAAGAHAHAEGQNTTAAGNESHSEGFETYAAGRGSHAEGAVTRATGEAAHAEGLNTIAFTRGSHAEGLASVAGYRRIPISNYDSSTRVFTFSPETSSSTANITQGAQVQVSYYDSTAETAGTFFFTVASRDSLNGSLSAVQSAPSIYVTPTTISGILSATTNNYSHAEGFYSTASGQASHAEGHRTTASGRSSHAEGIDTTASGNNSHAEGTATLASGTNSHAEGSATTASGAFSHAEGANTQARGIASHAEGISTVARFTGTHAAGAFATAAHNYTYIWADGGLGSAVTSVSSTRTGQYMVSASGGVFIPGNVGIGTDSIANPLTIVGNISASGYIISPSIVPTLPVPRIKLKGTTQNSGVQIPYLSASSISETTTVWTSGGMIDLLTYPVLAANDFTADELTRFNIFIEMVIYKTVGSSKPAGRSTQTRPYQSYTVPLGTTPPIWSTITPHIRNGDYSSVSHPKNVVARYNHIRVEHQGVVQNGGINLAQCLHGHFRARNIEYKAGNPLGENSVLPCIVPFGKKHKTVLNYSYSKTYKPLYIAFRYICWLPPNSTNLTGSFITGPLSPTIKVSNTKFPFRTNDYLSSLNGGAAVANINPVFNKNEFHCTFC